MPPCIKAGGDAVGRWCRREPLARDRDALIEDGDGPIEAFVDLDEGFRIAAALRTGEELDALSAERDRVVVVHGALVFEAEDRLGIAPGRPRAVGGCGIGRWVRKARIRAGEEVGQEGVRPLAVGDAGEAQFRAEPILEGPKEPLDATFRLRTAGGNPADAQFLQGTGDLRGCGFSRQLLLQGQRARGGGPVEDPVAIAVDGDGDAFPLREGLEDEEVAVRIFFIAKGGGGDLTGGVVHGGDEGQARAALVEPGVGAAIELDEEAFLKHPRTPSAVARWAAAPRAGHPRRAQDAADRGTREAEAFALGEELLQVVVVDADVDLGGEAHDARPDGVRDAVDGRAPPIPMDQGHWAPGTQGRTQAADLTDGSSEELGGLSHQQFTTVEGVKDFQALFGAGCQRDHASPSSAQSGADIFADPLGRTKSLIYHTAFPVPLTPPRPNATMTGCLRRVPDRDPATMSSGER